MLPSIDKNQQITKHLQLNPTQNHLKVKQKNGKKWQEAFRLISISTPEVIQKPSAKKIFKLQFVYKDSIGKKRTHVVYFGDKTDYIFHKNKKQRLKKILRMKNIDNPFHSDYWTAHLANKHQTLKQGLQKFTQYFIEQGNNLMKEKMNKKQLIIS